MSAAQAAQARVEAAHAEVARLVGAYERQRTAFLAALVSVLGASRYVESAGVATPALNSRAVSISIPSFRGDPAANLFSLNAAIDAEAARFRAAWLL